MDKARLRGHAFAISPDKIKCAPPTRCDRPPGVTSFQLRPHSADVNACAIGADHCVLPIAKHSLLCRNDAAM